MPKCVTIRRVAVLSGCCLAGLATSTVSISKPAPHREIVTSDTKVGAAHCGGRRIEATAGDSSKNSHMDRAKIVLCADKGSSAAHTRAMVENTIERIQKNKELSPAVRNELIAKLRSQEG